MPPAPSSAPTPGPWAVLGATTAVQSLVAMAALSPPVFAGPASADLGLPASAVGYYMSALYMAAMVASLASGAMMARFGAMRVSQACLVLAGLGLAVMAFSATLPTVLLALPAVLVGTWVLGLGYGPVTPASSHILAATTRPGNRALMFSIKQTGVPLGGVLAGALIPPLVLWGGWQGAALAVGAACLVLAGLVQPVRPALDRDRQPRAPLRITALAGPIRLIWRTPALRRLGLASFAFAAMQLCLGTFLVTFLETEAHMSLVDAGLVLSLTQGGGVVGRIIWGWVADRRVAPHLLLFLLGLGMAGGAVVFGLTGPDWPWLMVAGLGTLLGTAAIGWNGVFLSEVARHAPPGEAGAATGGALFMTFAGVVVGPALFALLLATPGGYPLAFAALAALCVAGAVAILGAGRRGPESP
ncbi:MFS transporter [Roseospirillum parvum]|uniref:Sugar phosphate permease n=1 Tax=Roseospirillum parvum TaxID=83401 RepID=A0A1G8E909_9PROT|nr:MFS transporter [Roseospirillum parvum]SDH66395.1 Sugar phosphate permease [Roseospirillum parvum]